MIENNISLPKVFIDITQYLHPPFLLDKDAYSVVKPWNHDGETLISHNSWRSGSKYLQKCAKKFA